MKVGRFIGSTLLVLEMETSSVCCFMTLSLCVCHPILPAGKVACAVLAKRGGGWKNRKIL